MKDFFYKNYFELKDFTYKDLFLKSEPAWYFLKNIKNYILSLKKEKIKKEFSHCHIENKDSVFIGKNVKIDPYTYIKGPCIIEDNCHIRHNAYIRENVIIGKNCVIGHGSEIKNSIMLSNSKASHFAYIGDSIIGNNVNMGAGAVIANMRLDKKDIFFYYKNKKIRTNLKKFGAILSDNVQIGCNTVINPGTIIGKNTYCMGSLNICGYYKKNIKITSNFNL